MQQYIGILGVVAILFIGWLCSTNRRAINRRTIIVGVAIQFAVAFLLLRFPPIAALFTLFARAVTRVISFADEGTRFIFGNAADASGAWGFIFVVQVLPVIIFFASLMAVLYHLGVMQRVVAVLASIIQSLFELVFRCHWIYCDTDFITHVHVANHPYYGAICLGLVS